MFYFLSFNYLTYLKDYWNKFIKKFTSLDGFSFFKVLLVVLILDGLILDDEPLWEPLEWSVIQTWVLYIYIFSWAAEVIFSSRYGSFTNRDKVVWIGLFKAYYGLLFWILINMFVVTVFITLPFYFEITYMISYSVVWWNWVSSVFFFKFVSIFSLIVLLSMIFRFQLRWLNLNSLKLILILIIFLISYLFYFNFITTWFAYFTDPNEFKNSGWSDLSKITNGSLKWGWGTEARDHFTSHKTPTVFWAKNDQLILGSFLFLNIFVFLYMFFLFLQVMFIYRVLVSSSEVSYNMATFLYSTLKQFLYLVLSFGILTVLSLFYQFIRFPFELAWFGKVIYLSQIEWSVFFDFIDSFFFWFY